MHTAAIWHGVVEAKQNHAAIIIRRAKGQDLRHERADLPRGEIHHRHDLPPHQIILAIEFGDLRR